MSDSGKEDTKLKHGVIGYYDKTYILSVYFH